VRQVEAAIGVRFDERLAERTRLARDLHDTLLQTIQVSKMVADDSLGETTDAVRMRGDLGQLSAWLGRAIEEGRAALNSLRPPTAEGSDLICALKRATEDGVVPASMTVACSVVGDPRDVHPIVRDEASRIGSEAIRNASLHSGGSRLRVDLEYAQNLVLRVADNGVGIDPGLAAHGKPGHFGLQGMRERAVRIQGRLTITGSAGLGTAMELVVPGGVAFRNGHAARVPRIWALIRNGARSAGRPTSS
jgi:signal transduction histidine kinase